METFVFVMIFLVVGGTLFDVAHKKNGKYFFGNWKKIKQNAVRELDVSEVASIAIKTAGEGLAAAEFKHVPRQLAHLLSMYGFILYLIATIMLVFGYQRPESGAPDLLIGAWYLGAVMVSAGGYWFWFFIRVDVAAEGNSPFRFVQADLFVVSLTLSTTFGVLWGLFQTIGADVLGLVFLVAYLVVSIVLFGSVPWSKLAHMFFKPAAAFARHYEQANGYRRKLPSPADKPANLGTSVAHHRNY